MMACFSLKLILSFIIEKNNIVACGLSNSTIQVTKLPLNRNIDKFRNLLGKFYFHRILAKYNNRKINVYHFKYVLLLCYLKN